MTIEQEFIKCFKLSRYSYVCKFKGNTVWFHTWDIQRMINFIKKGWKVVKVEKLPDPPITPEIVLKLEEILFHLNCNVYLERTLGHHENKSKPYESINGEIKYSLECHFEWCYEVFDLGDYFESEDKTYNDWRIVSHNVNRIEALLVIFTKIIKNKNILLDKEIIQDQVKECF